MYTIFNKVINSNEPFMVVSLCQCVDRVQVLFWKCEVGCRQLYIH